MCQLLYPYKRLANWNPKHIPYSVIPFSINCPGRYWKHVLFDRPIVQLIRWDKSNLLELPGPPERWAWDVAEQCRGRRWTTSSLWRKILTCQRSPACRIVLQASWQSIWTKNTSKSSNQFWHSQNKWDTRHRSILQPKHCVINSKNVVGLCLNRIYTYAVIHYLHTQ